MYNREVMPYEVDNISHYKGYCANVCFRPACLSLIGCVPSANRLLSLSPHLFPPINDLLIRLAAISLYSLLGNPLWFACACGF